MTIRTSSLPSSAFLAEDDRFRLDATRHNFRDREPSTRRTAIGSNPGSAPTDESAMFLSTDLAGPREVRFAATTVLVSAIMFIFAAPFAKIQLAPVPAFIPIYASALVICDVITAALLFGQFRFSRSRALLILASGYVFTASMTTSYTMLFPGLFSPTGLLGSGPQSTSAMYMLWHDGFPLLVICYALLKNRTPGTAGTGDPARINTRAATLSGIAIVVAVVVGITAFVTAGHHYLPVFIEGNRTTGLGRLVLLSDWILSLLTLGVLWWRRPHSVIDLWLMVVICAWLFDIALSAILNAGRYDLGWYVGRVYGLVAASFVLIVLMIESGNYHARLARLSAKLGAANKALQQLSWHDGLTGLANRVLFLDRLDQAVASTGRGSEFAVIYLDLDHFKPVNDKFGHPVGDGLLQAVADRLEACVREGDTVARLGGDEFAIIQLAIGQPHHAEVLTSRVLGAFCEPFTVKGHQIEVGISMGVAVAPGDGTAAETLLRNADIALYLAKTEGRGTVRFFEPEMDTCVQLRRTLELDLRDAIVRNEFELYYQPLINLVAGKITGFEALLRWHHPTRGLISPSDFIPIAEETGLIMAIGEWVVRTACFEAENWPAEISVAVNLSPIQFRKGNLVSTIREALTASGLRPHRLELEITESVLLQDTPGTLTALHELRSMGISVALDDFGTAYSSLSYLRSFPFDKIKIDQSFVRDLVRNKESMSIIRAVAGLGNSLNIKTTAEGVETLEQLNRLRDEGCTEVQGYLFSHPKPANELPLLIEKLQRIDEVARF